MKSCVIAIDGPAASGKSTVARGLAARLSFAYINSGIMYRAVTWHILKCQADPASSEELTTLIQSAVITTGFENNQAFIAIDGVRPGNELLAAEVNRAVSAVSTNSAVRERLVCELRALAASRDVVVEGRDIGSVVFPDTPFKFYLDAPQSVRQRRREAQGQQDEIALRDRIDSSRHNAPLVVAGDAIVVDTGALDLPGVIDTITARLREMGLPGASR